MNKTVLAFVNKLEGYKTAIKQLHWDAKNMSQHELCDDIAESIAEFQDTVSEVEQSITGKLKINSLNPTEYKIKDLKSFVEDVLDATNTFYKAIKDKGDTYVGMASDCESFLSDMQRKLYLVNFTMKEDFKREFREKIYESMPKNLAHTDEVDKFMGRRPKTMKARINQIYRIVKKYGIDSRLYSDENWQAISDYYKAISSLGCEVEMKPCGHIENIDSMESDGGYCDYGDDNMAHSKQYAVKITFEDGMSIEGYIKCMAAGTMEDPFSRYDTCIVLWPKNNRVLENMEMNRQISLTEGELKQIVKEAAIKVIREYSERIITEEDSAIKVMIDGTLMTFKNSKEYKKFIEKRKQEKSGVVAKKPKKRKVAKTGIGSQADPRTLAKNIADIIYDKALKSIKTFIMHSERSFGSKAVQALVNLYKSKAGTNLFNDYNVKYNEINSFVNDIQNWGANDEHAVYERCSRLSNSLRDLCDILSSLANVTQELKSTNKLQTMFGNGTRNILVGSGDGRELGLYGLAFAKNAKVLAKILQKLGEMANLLEEVSKNGRDPFDYEV